MTADHTDIRIGTIAQATEGVNYLRQIIPHGFESFELSFPPDLEGMDLNALASDVKACLDEFGNTAVISSLGVYGNPLQDEKAVHAWETLIDRAPAFGCDLVCGFTGRIADKPIPESLPAFKRVFGELAKRAAGKGIRLAFENCDMGGTWEYGNWNIAHSPHAWEMMFHELPDANLGLEWEPCHQMNSLVDPLPQLRKWVHKIVHLHGKDATVLHDVVREYGIRGGKTYVYHRTPGFGDSNWTDIISMLRLGGFKGAIDIEGWHDPVYRDALEMTGQVHALNYLKQCRGGDCVPNPT
ncbi:MAG: sugar phosphate isomerase/epimerase [Candidatus Pacebacteria bacterium]|nr:sugar phosphate isomerase/epimerase [Candidatus Paceibacterota bacterium]